MFAARTPGREALDEIDRALKAQPRKDDHALSAATRELARMREGMLARRDGGGRLDPERLAHLNAVIAVVMAMHFPLGQPPWAELKKARGWLAALLKEDA